MRGSVATNENSRCSWRILRGFTVWLQFIIVCASSRSLMPLNCLWKKLWRPMDPAPVFQRIRQAFRIRSFGEKSNRVRSIRLDRSSIFRNFSAMSLTRVVSSLCWVVSTEFIFALAFAHVFGAKVATAWSLLYWTKPRVVERRSDHSSAVDFSSWFDQKKVWII